ncbi:MAG: hypothetical protein ACRD2Z_04560 [Thermoanaerobaculia bacterium]
MIEQQIETSPEEDRQRVEEALRRVESAVRQRHAQLATRSVEREAVQAQLLELREAELLREATTSSPRPVIGPLLVWARKAVYHLFVKWQMRPLLQQQSRFNQAAARLLEDSLEAQERMAEELERLRARVEEEREPAGRDASESVSRTP